MINPFPRIMFFLTRKDRYSPNFVFEENSLFYNVFRLYELVFWRKSGIRAEVSMTRTKEGYVYYAFHTWEAALVNIEGWVRNWFKNFKLAPFRVYIPQIATPQSAVFTSPYLFAIAFDTSGNNYQNATTTASVSLSTSGSNRFAAIFTLTGGGNRFSSLTVGGVAATAVVDAFNPFGTNFLYGRYFVAPPTASTAYTLTTTNNADDQEIGVLTYSGCAQSGQVDSSNTGTGSPNLMLSTTVVASNCWLVSCARNSAGAASASTGTTLRQAGTSLATGDSNGTVPTGAQPLAWTAGGGTTGGIIFSIAPFVATPVNSNFLYFMPN